MGNGPWNGMFSPYFFLNSVSGGATGRNDSCAFRLPEADPNKESILCDALLSAADPERGVFPQ